MKFTVDKDTLKNALDCAIKGMDMSSTLDLRSGVLITAEGATLRLETNNLEVCISQHIIANVEEPGQVVVSCKLLSETIGHLPSRAISCKLTGSVFEVECGTSSYKMATLSPQDFPRFPSYTIESQVIIPTESLGTMINKVAVAASTDKNRSILNGVLVSITHDMVRFVTTDSVRLAVAEAKVMTETQNFEVIVAAKTLRSVLSLAAAQKNITIGVNASQIVFSFGDVIYVTRRIEGNYPNYKKLIPSSYTTALRVKINDLYEALQRIKAYTITNSELRLQILASEGRLVITSNIPDQGSAREELVVDAQGEDQNIAFNSRFIFDCVQKAEDDSYIEFEMENQNKPGIFKTLGKIDFLYLVMPVRTTY